MDDLGSGASRARRQRGRLTSELLSVERRELERTAVPAPTFAEGTGQIRVTPAVCDNDFDDDTWIGGAPDLAVDPHALVAELVTPLTVLLAVQEKMMSAVRSAGDRELLDELRRYIERGQEAMDAIQRVLAELRSGG
jgi:hypothetical protein